MNQDKKKVLAIIGFVIIGIIVLPLLYGVAGGIYSLSSRARPIPTANPLRISSQNWQTYENLDDGYRVSYPPELYVAQAYEGYSATFLVEDLREFDLELEIQPRIQIFKADTPLTEFLAEVNENRNKEQFPEFQEISINGKSAFQTKPFDEEVIFYHTILGTDEKSYLIELFTLEKENDALIEAYTKILENFEIIANE